MVDLSKYLEQAADAAKRRNYAMAVKIYGQVLAIQPDFGEARSGLRKVLFQKVAQKPASKLTAVLFGGLNLPIAGMMRLIGQHGAAAKGYERYLAYDPTAEGPNLKLGMALRRAGLTKSALAVYAAYAEHQPRCLEACREAGALYYEQGKVNEALAMYELALKVDPRDQDSLKARKNLAAEGALKSTGIETAESSRDLIKDEGKQQELERSERLQLSADEVVAELEEIEAQLQENPDDQKRLRRAARLREMAKDLQGALDLIDRLLQKNPSDGELLEIAADLRIRLQEQMVQKAVKRGDEGAAKRARAALAQLRVGSTATQPTWARASIWVRACSSPVKSTKRSPSCSKASRTRARRPTRCSCSAAHSNKRTCWTSPSDSSRRRWLPPVAVSGPKRRSTKWASSARARASTAMPWRTSRRSSNKTSASSMSPRRWQRSINEPPSLASEIYR